MGFLGSISFDVLTMVGCGHVTAVPSHTVTQLRRSHENFYCSTCGRPNHFLEKSDVELEREKTERAERNLKWAESDRARARDAAAAADRRATAYKGHLTRQRKRASAGTCPCCKRTFKALSQHMLKQHPEYVEKQR